MGKVRTVELSLGSETPDEDYMPKGFSSERLVANIITICMDSKLPSLYDLHAIVKASYSAESIDNHHQ